MCGPTGAGKTDFSYQLAEKFPIEIINCDVGQLYEPLSIGTAKPDWKHHAIPHHLFDVVKEPRNFTVTEYRALVKKTMEEIWQRKALPVVVGGSMFYLRALLFPAERASDSGDMQGSEQSPHAAQDTPVAVLSKEEKLKLWHELYEIDPDRAQNIDKNDGYRIQRALHIWHTSGVKPSLYAPTYQPLGNFHITFITRDREELYKRIDERVLTMFEQGWPAEVAALSPEWRAFLLQKKLLGYPEIIAMLQENVSSEERAAVCAQIQKKTRNYAKRQITFWRSLKEAIDERAGTPTRCEELNLTLSSVDLYLNHIQHTIDAACDAHEKGLR